MHWTQLVRVLVFGFGVMHVCAKRTSGPITDKDLAKAAKKKSPSDKDAAPALPGLDLLSKTLKKTSKAKAAPEDGDDEAIAAKKSSKTKTKASAPKKRPAEKTKPSKKDAVDESDDFSEEMLPPAPKSASSGIGVLHILGFAAAGLGFAIAAISFIIYAVSKVVSRRSRRLRYMESLKPAYIRRGDGLDEYREVIE
ncbi:hypothetical protein NEDG_00993 [Nematocida displodere]|uniref:Uncharacterized protein n=1 Tax=Nematocida displodere TaxID=1805483 RepID=A0A177EA89_9MICR|nr:hypothetical protein NEDG_00993 [Nematocida displodere]